MHNTIQVSASVDEETISEGQLLWTPSPAVIQATNLTGYLGWLRTTRGLDFPTYQALWQWSTTAIEAFWASLWDYFAVVSSSPYSVVLTERKMPGARWFVGAHLNFAENIFQRQTTARPALLYQSETEPLTAISWQTLYAQTAKLAHALRTLGVGRGDRVVAYLPNIPEAIIGVLACASLGAIWSSCSPDFGSRSVLDRFSQIGPKVLLAVDSYQYGGKTFDRRATIAELQAALPTLQKTILVTQRATPAAADLPLANTVDWQAVMAAAAPEALTFEQVPFDHPLWVLYSSGTTGLPKPIVQGHGGILLEHAKVTTLHNDLKATDRFFWYTSTGWMMWNYLVGSLLTGCTVILYNGSPNYPDMNTLWRLAETSGMTYFGTSAAYINACLKAGLQPKQHFALDQLRALGSTGSPLSVAGFAWIYRQVSPHLALESTSGGTDLCTAFIGGVRMLPIYAGELQSPLLGASVQAWNEAGEPVVDEVGELVITQPMPSMPLYFWNDVDNERYLASYFDLFPGIWRHGDWLKLNGRGGGVIYGRSDATINRQGVRMGTSEIYRVVEGLNEVVDSLVIDLEALGGASYMPLFVVLRPGVQFDEALQQRIKQQIRQELSPRHVPDAILAVDQVPYTLSGKKMETPIRRILLGHPVEKVVTPGAMRNPEALAYFIALRERREESAVGQ